MASLFLHPEQQISDEMLEESLRTLAEKNARIVDNTTVNDGFFKCSQAAELVLKICTKLNLPLEVRYIALETFDRFMKEHINELHELVVSSSSAQKKLDWTTVEGRVRDQVPLRAVTCVQIASKLVSHYKALTPSKVKRFLGGCGLHYSITSVTRSEVRVLKTLDYRLTSVSPLTHVEIILEVLRRNCPGLVAEKVHDVCTKILDVVYIERLAVRKLLADVTGVVGVEDEKLGNDHLFLAAVVIVTAGYVIDAETSDQFIEQISLITCLPEADVIMYSTVLVKVVLDLA